MKYYTIVYPGNDNSHIQETLSEFQIIKAYLPYWLDGMKKADKLNRDTIKNCISMCVEDWVNTHWAYESDGFGNMLAVKENNDIPF